MKHSTYYIINLVLIGLLLYLLFLPAISPIMSQLFPDLWQCQYLRITGQECPFCGLTKDFRDIMSLGSSTPRNSFAYVLFAFCTGELFLRSAVSIVLIKKVSFGKILVIDITYNIIFVIIVCVCIVAQISN